MLALPEMNVQMPATETASLLEQPSAPQALVATPS